MITENFTVKKAFAEGFKLLKRHGIVFIGLVLGYYIINMLISLFGGGDIYTVKYWVVFLFTLLLSSLFLSGIIKMILSAIDGEEPEFSAFKESLPRVIPYFVASIIYTLIAFIGLLLLIVPGIYFSARFMFVGTIIIDKPEVSILDAFKESYNMTKGKVMSLVGMCFVALGISILGLLCLLVGIFPATVWVTMAYVCSYRMIQYDQSQKALIAEAPKTENEGQI